MSAFKNDSHNQQSPHFLYNICQPVPFTNMGYLAFHDAFLICQCFNTKILLTCLTISASLLLNISLNKISGCQSSHFSGCIKQTDSSYCESHCIKNIFSCYA